MNDTKLLLKMPFDINEDKQLRIIWFKYENEINDLKTRFYKNEKIRPRIFRYSQMTDNMFEKQVDLDNEIRMLEEQRRKEMKEIRTKVRKEKAEKIEKEKLELEKKRQENAEKKRINRELREKLIQQSPPPLRRSARVHNKINNDPESIFRRGSIYKKE